MIRASLYILVRSSYNRARLRVRRLREPRYLLGALASAAYLYFAVFRLGRGSGAGRRRGAAVLPFAAAVDAPSIAALLLTVSAALSWAVPFRANLLDFSRPEVQFLFPAPISRRQLLVHRLIRSQLGLLFAAIVPAVLFPRGSGAARARFAVAMWVLLAGARFFLTGVSLSRPWLLRGSPRVRLLAWMPLVVSLAAALAVAAVLADAFLATPPASVAGVFAALDALVSPWPVSLALTPFKALVRPLLADSWTAYAAALPGALSVLGALGAWVLLSDEAFDAEVEAVVEGQQARPAVTASRYRVRGRGWPLAAEGRPEWALVWKAAMESVRHRDARTFIRVTLPTVTLVTVATAAGLLPRALSEVLSVLAIVALGFATFMGPQVLRSDLRQELEHLALLKTWPIPAGAALRGLLIWPVALLTVIVWGLVLVAELLLPFAFPGVPPAWRAATMLAACVLVPGLVAAQYVVHNAAALMFPAWVASGRHRPRGFDAMGQRLILLAGTWLALGLMMIPGLVLGALVWGLLRPLLGAGVLVIAALVCGAALLGEAAAATGVLGPALERMDETDVERVD